MHDFTIQSQFLPPDDDGLPDAADPAEFASAVGANQAERWENGLYVPIEAYLARHPGLKENEDLWVALIYGEFQLRERLGQTPSVAEFIWRFPACAVALRAQLERHLGQGTDDGRRDLAQTVVYRTQSGAPIVPAQDCGFPIVPGYQIIELAGRGGMGVVYKARHRQLDRVVALKMLPGVAATHPELYARFQREARATARLAHPHIVTVYEVGEHAGQPYISLQFVEGETLSARLRREGSLAPRAAAELLIAVCDAVAEAHRQKILHRDLKPANILLDEDGRPLVADFGLAEWLEENAEETRTEAILGTPGYMAPEQARGDGPGVDGRADVYSLGAILFELITGELPFRGDPHLLVLQILRDEPPSPRKLNPGVPRDLATIALKCLQKEPERRYQSPQLLADDLRRFLAGESILARPSGLVERSWRWCRRNPLLSSLAAAIVLAMAAGTGISAYFAVRASAFARESDERAREAVTQQKQAEANLAEANRQRRRAEANYRDARAAADRDATAGGNERLGGTAVFQPLRGELFEADCRDFRGLAAQLTGDLSGQWSQAVEQWREGTVACETGSKSKGIAAYRQAIALTEDLIATGGDSPAIRAALARFEMDCGLALQGFGRAVAANRSLQNAFNALEPLAQAAGADERLRALFAESATRLGLGQVAIASHVEARASLDAALQAQEALVRDFPANPHHRFALAACRVNLGIVHYYAGRAEPGADEFRAAEALCEQLVHDFPDQPRYGFGLAQARLYHARALIESGRLEEAVGLLAASVDRAEKLAAADPRFVDFRRLEAWDYLYQAVIHMRYGQGAEAEAAFLKSFALQEEFAAQDPGNLFDLSQRIAGCLDIGQLHSSTGRHAEAVAATNKEIAGLTEIVLAFPHDATYKSDLVARYVKLAYRHLDAGQPVDADASLVKAVELAKEVAAETGLDIYRTDAFARVFELGRFRSLQRRHSDALAAYEAAVAEWDAGHPSDIIDSRLSIALARVCGGLAVERALAGREWAIIEEARARIRVLAPGEAMLWVMCSDAAAIAGRWQEASAQYAPVVDNDGRQFVNLYHHAHLLAAAGDEAGYRATCQEMINRFADSSDAGQVASLLRVLLVGQRAIENWDRPLALARKLSADYPNNVQTATLLGATLYRAGMYEEALNALTAAKAIQRIIRRNVKSLDGPLSVNWVMTECYLTMAYEALGRSDDARSVRDRLTKELDEAPAFEPEAERGMRVWERSYVLDMRTRMMTPPKTPAEQPAQ